MIKSHTILLISGFIALFLFSSPLYAAKLTPVGEGTKFSGTASVDVSIYGPRYDTNNDPITGVFSGSGLDTITFDDAEAFLLRQARTTVLDDVVNSQTYTYEVIDVSAIITSNQSLYATWYDSGEPEEVNRSVPAWVENYANNAGLSTICDAYVDPYSPSYQKTASDDYDANNDYITSLSVTASVGQEPDSAQFTIEPMLLEQIGDEIDVTIRNNIPRIDIFNTDVVFSTSTDTESSVKINGTIVPSIPIDLFEDPLIVTAQIGDTVTLSSAASLSTGIGGNYQIPTSHQTSYRLHRSMVTKGLSVQVAEAAGVSEENPIIGNSGQRVVFPAVPIESGGPGIDSPVWFRTPDGTALEIQVNGVGLSAFEMPGDLPVGPQPGPIEGSVAVWYYDSSTWVEHEWSPMPPGGRIDFSPGVTRIQLRGIDRTAPDPADNLFNAGLYFDGATTAAQVTISNVSATSLVPVINLLLGD